MTTPIDRQGRALIDRATRYYGGGGTVTLRRRHSLLDPVSGKPPTSLLLDGLHAEGAMSLTLKAARLAGRIVPGIRLTISGSQYEVQGEVAASGNGLSGVTISPGLVAQAADETTVTVESHREYSFRRMQGRQVEELEDGSVAIGKQTLLLSTQGSSTTPRRDDTVVIGGLPDEVEDVQTIGPGATPWGWRVVRAGRAA